MTQIGKIVQLTTSPARGNSMPDYMTDAVVLGELRKIIQDRSIKLRDFRAWLADRRNAATATTIGMIEEKMDKMGLTK